MAGIDIFISYKSERRKAAEHLAAVLGYYGYSVWFDYELIKGSDFGLQIDRRIREAKSVIALWCSLSVGSRWVIEEADLAYRLGILIPVKIESCELPVGFRRQDYVNLSSWDGAPRSHLLDPLLDALEQRTGRPPHLDLKGVREYEDIWRRFGAPSLRTFALGKPLEDAVGDRKIPQNRSPVIPAAEPEAPDPIDHRHELAVLAAREWPAVRDSADPQRLELFERHFAGTFHAGEARLLREKIESELKRQAAEGERRDADLKQRQEDEQKFRAEGRIPVPVGGRGHSEMRWLLPGGGEPFCDINGGPEMVVVPAGAFMMGSPDDEPERSGSEGPRHRVTFARPFAAGRYAITRGQFAAFVNATGHKANGWRSPGFSQDDSHPVVCIRWEDAKAYAGWMAEITAQPYRLLSEAEWEYAARAGAATPFWWGSSITPSQANYDSNYVYAGGGRKGEYRRGTVPAGSFDPNPWGLYNVHGNVWEWCEDVWHGSYDGAPADGSAWISTRVLAWFLGDGRVVRGGSWYDDPGRVRAANRSRLGVEASVIGFRLARTLAA